MNGLERSLTALSHELAVPEAPDLVERVRAEIGRRPAAPAWAPRRRLVLAVAVGVLAALGATLAIPDARSALLRIFNLGGERIELVEELPEVGLEHDLEFVLGERVTLEEAERRSGFDLSRPGQLPDRVYVGDRGTIWMLYGTPQKVRLLIAQTPLATLPRDVFLKKLAAPGTTVQPVDVDGAPGLFISGNAHLVLLLDENGDIVDDAARLAQDVLLWERGGVAYRLEGDFSLEDALRVARELA